MRILELLGSDTGKALLAGAAGGVVRWATLRQNWREGFAALTVGALCAVWLGPIVEPIIRPIVGPITPHNDPTGFASFIVGLGGISLSGFIIDIFTARRAKGGDDEQP